MGTHMYIVVYIHLAIPSRLERIYRWLTELKEKQVIGKKSPASACHVLGRHWEGIALDPQKSSFDRSNLLKYELVSLLATCVHCPPVKDRANPT